MDLLDLVKEMGVVDIINAYVADLELADNHKVMMEELKETVTHGIKDGTSFLRRGRNWCDLVFVRCTHGLGCKYAIAVDNRIIFYNNNHWTEIRAKIGFRINFWRQEYLND